MQLLLTRTPSSQEETVHSFVLSAGQWSFSALNRESANSSDGHFQVEEVDCNFHCAGISDFTYLSCSQWTARTCREEVDHLRRRIPLLTMRLMVRCKRKSAARVTCKIIPSRTCKIHGPSIDGLEFNFLIMKYSSSGMAFVDLTLLQDDVGTHRVCSLSYQRY